MKRLFIILGLLVGISQAQTTTTITGTIKDLSQALVTSGKVTFTLQPSRDTTISGLARFSPAQVVCLINASGLIKAQDGTSVCTLTMNTALNPPGTYYRVDVWPFNVKTSSFTFYAVLSAYDWSTVVPTPTTSPAQNFVDIFSTQTIGGNKTFTGNLTLPGSATFSLTTLSDYSVAGFTKLNNGLFLSSSLVTKGALDLYNNATGVIFRNGVFNGTLGKTGTLQAGDTASGTATWLANSVYNLPDLAQGGVIDSSGFLYGADATTLNNSVNNCVFGGGSNTTNSAGILKNSGFGCNSNIIFPTLGHAIEWQNGVNTLTLQPSALTGNRTLVPPDASGTLTLSIASGTATMTTAAIAGGACGTTVTVSATGTLTTDSINHAFNASVGANPGVLIINKWPTANNVNFNYCNPTAGSITPSAATLNWAVVR